MNGFAAAYVNCPTYSLSGPFIKPSEALTHDHRQPTLPPHHQHQHQHQQRTMDTSSEITEKPPRPAIEVDSNPGDDKSVFGEESFLSGLTSVASSIPNFIYENGRRYHSLPGKYVLPNDEREQERLDIVHYIFRSTLDGDLCYTKLENPQKILDVGTGTGVWAIEIGNEFPSAEVIGTDLSPIQPGTGSNTLSGIAVPPNVQFQVDDATQEWTFPTASFDFIHIRTLYGGISDWPALLRECYKALKPGGKVEISEMRTRLFCDDGTYPQDSKMSSLVNELHRVARSVGIELDISPLVPDWLRNTGFTEVEQAVRVVPAGIWPRDRKLKQMGYYMVAQMVETALDSYSIALLTRHGGHSEEHVRHLLNRVTDELKSNKFHVYTKLEYSIGKKPMTESAS